VAETRVLEQFLAENRIAPVLVPLAVVGPVLLMGAVIVHLRRHEAEAIVVPLALLALAVLVAWGRFGPQSFTG
jgi:DoxX-like family